MHEDPERSLPPEDSGREGVGELRGTVCDLERPDRKQAIPDLNLPARWIMWAKVKNKESDPEYMRNRVCVARVMDDGVALEGMIPQRMRTLLVKEYFNGLTGNQVSFERKYTSQMEYKKAVPESLAERYRAERFSEILAWFMRNRPDALADSCKSLQKRKEK